MFKQIKNKYKRRSLIVIISILSLMTTGLFPTINNASVSTSETTLAADDMLRKTVTLQFTPETPLGVANLRTSALASSVAFFNWA